jgi:hypothetical protein
MYLAAVVLFDAIPTGWVSKHNSVGLIPLQRRYSYAVLRSVGVSQNVLIIASEPLHFGIVRRYNCVKVGLADFLHFISHIFYRLISIV